MLLRTSNDDDADLVISINMQNYGGERFFQVPKWSTSDPTAGEFANFSKTTAPDGTLPFRARNVLQQKSSGPPSHFTNHHYFLWENFTAIGDKTAWR